jgi:lipopolysaccharide/colanic/teichoic acid biosynthesis glycosyltransferase
MDYVPLYNARQARRHEVRPGLTGWSQVNGRNALTWDEKLEFDIWYVDHASFSLDMKIILMTVLKVLRREGIVHPGDVAMPRFRGTASEKQRVIGAERKE